MTYIISTDKGLEPCNGKIGQDSRCEKCFGMAQSSSAYCTRLTPKAVENSAHSFTEGYTLERETEGGTIGTHLNSAQVESQANAFEDLRKLLWQAENARPEELHGRIEYIKSQFSVARKGEAILKPRE